LSDFLQTWDVESEVELLTADKKGSVFKTRMADSRYFEYCQIDISVKYQTVSIKQTDSA